MKAKQFLQRQHPTRNSLSLDMMTRLKEDISEAARDKTVRSIVLRGEGKVFSAGHNLKELTRETSYEEHKAVFAQCESLMLLVGKVGLNALYNVCWGRERTKTPCYYCTFYKQSPNIES